MEITKERIESQAEYNEISFATCGNSYIFPFGTVTGTLEYVYNRLMEYIKVQIIKRNTPNFPLSDQWEYCVFLGTFVDSKGKDWDLGIMIRNYDDDTTWIWSAACVYGNDGGNYISGENVMYENREDNFEHIAEMINRAKYKNLIF